MARYVFITGGVVSSLGKGLASAALGALLQARGYSVRLRKLDPYLNVDPGTMSPFEHGEVFVTDDGAETDLDLGHYERFTGVSARKTDSVSSGRIYSTVLEKERRGDYLGKTIQVIPHVTNEIKDFIAIGDDEVDFMLCEIGGTVGDIEGLPFFEAIRQFAQDRPRGECVFMHLTLLPWIGAAGELKTKPTQHSVKELTGLGIQPDILLLRCDRDLDEKVKQKVGLFCNVATRSVITAKDVSSIYRLPLALEEEGLHNRLTEKLHIWTGSPKLRAWEKIANVAENPKQEVCIAMVGKYVDLADAYKSLNEALAHGGIANECAVRIIHVDSEAIEAGKLEADVTAADGILVPMGFGERGTEGKITAVRYARENKVPFLGICFGMQMAVIEFARNVCGLERANSVEVDPETPNPVIDMMLEQRGLSDMGGTMRLGAYPCTVKEGTLAHKVYGKKNISERHRHRYEFNTRFRQQIEDAGMVLSGTSPDGSLVEMVEIPDHPWFLASQFHPEFKSRPLDCHPMFKGFVKAALQRRLDRAETPTLSGLRVISSSKGTT